MEWSGGGWGGEARGGGLRCWKKLGEVYRRHTIKCGTRTTATRVATCSRAYSDFAIFFCCRRVADRLSGWARSPRDEPEVSAGGDVVPPYPSHADVSTMLTGSMIARASSCSSPVPTELPLQGEAFPHPPAVKFRIT